MPGKDVQVYSIVCGSGSVRGEGGGLVLLLLIWGALDCDDSESPDWLVAVLVASQHIHIHPGLTGAFHSRSGAHSDNPVGAYKFEYP